MSNYLRIRDRIAINQGPFVASPTWVDISDQVRNTGPVMATGRQSRNGAFEAASMTIDMTNRDGRWTPFNSASAYYPLSTGAPFQRDCEYPVGSGTWLPLWSGTLSDAQAGFEGQAAGVSQLTFQQRLAQSAQRPLPALVVGQILATSPTGFWPMSDAGGSEGAEDARGVGYPALSVKRQATAPRLAFGVGDAPGPDAGGTRVAFTPASDYESDTMRNADLSVGFWGSFTMAAVIQGAYQPTFFATNTIYQLLDIFSGGFTVSINPAGLLTVVVTQPFVGSVTSLASTTVVGDNQEHAIGFDIDKVGTVCTVRLLVDGVVEATGTFTYFNMDMNLLTVGASNWFYDTTISPFNGTLANLAHWTLYDPTVHEIYAKSITGFDTDTADVRFRRLVALAGVPSSWALTLGTFNREIQSAGTQGRTLTEVLQELETAENGRLSVDHQGRIVLASANAYYSPTRSLTLDGQRHFSLGGTFGTDTDGLVNTWSGSRVGGEVLTVVDEASQDQQGIQANSNTDMPLTNDDDVLQVGFWKINTTATPVLRFPSVVVTGDRLHADGLLAGALALSEGDQLVLTNLPSAAPGASFTGQIQRIERAWSGRNLVFTFTVSEWMTISTWDSNTDGRWAEEEGTITLSASTTSSATSIVAITSSGNPPLTNAVGNLPFDIEIAGERMTVTAVSAASSPQTLTVTRGVSPTRSAAHASGSQISIYSPGKLGI